MALSVQTLTSNKVATAALTQFRRQVGVSIIPNGQDWAARQRIQYAALKGLIKEEFLGLKDWAEQIKIYSQTNWLTLMPSYMAIRLLLLLNRNLIPGLIYNPILKLTVGRLLLSITGFDKAFARPTEILEDNVALKRTLI